MRKPDNYAWLPKDTTATMVSRFSIIDVFQMYFEIFNTVSKSQLAVSMHKPRHIQYILCLWLLKEQTVKVTLMESFRGSLALTRGPMEN